MVDKAITAVSQCKVNQCTDETRGHSRVYYFVLAAV